MLARPPFCSCRAGRPRPERRRRRRARRSPEAKGNVKQSICRWCYGKIALDKLCEIAKKLGYRSIELLGDKEVLEVEQRRPDLRRHARATASPTA